MYEHIIKRRYGDCGISREDNLPQKCPLFLQNGAEKQNGKQTSGENQQWVMPLLRFTGRRNRLVITCIAPEITSEQYIPKSEIVYIRLYFYQVDLGTFIS